MFVGACRAARRRLPGPWRSTLVGRLGAGGLAVGLGLGTLLARGDEAEAEASAVWRMPVLGAPFARAADDDHVQAEAEAAEAQRRTPEAEARTRSERQRPEQFGGDHVDWFVRAFPGAGDGDTQGAARPDMSGHWKIDKELCKRDESTMVDIMLASGIPNSLVRLGGLYPSSMVVTQSSDGDEVKERISQLRGLYSHTVLLHMDEREVVGIHPLNRSKVHTVSRWERLPVAQLQPCSMGPGVEDVVCCVSYGFHEKSFHKQRIIRFLDDDGRSFHSINTLFKCVDAKADAAAKDEARETLTAHRILRRIPP